MLAVACLRVCLLTILFTLPEVKGPKGKTRLDRVRDVPLCLLVSETEATKLHRVLRHTRRCDGQETTHEATLVRNKVSRASRKGQLGKPVGRVLQKQ